MNTLTMVRLKVQGRVQGVFYRQSTLTKARSLGLSGWVRNAYDGSVEIEALGNRARIDELVAWCWDGPPAARVETVDVESLEEVEAERASGQFEVR